MRWTGLTNILYLFTTCLLHVSADSLQYVCTAYTPGMNSSELLTVVGLLNGEQFMCYNKKSTEDWMKKAESKDVWKSHLESMRDFQNVFHNQFTTALQQFNHSKRNFTGVPTLQWMYGCKRDHGTNSAYSQYAFDGEDLITLDLNTGAWNTSKNPQAVNAKNEWDPEGHQAKYWRSFLNSDCFVWLKSFVSYGRENLERKVRPEVSVFHKNSSPEVVCHATGFFPKSVNITWQKDGEEVHEDVELRETLPNQDGSFQKRSILKVPAEELQKHNYTCVIQHSSSEEQIVREVPKGGGSDKISGGAPITIIVAVVVPFIALVVFGVVIWRKRKNSGERKRKNSGENRMKNSGERRKKNSGFTPVPANEPL